MKRLATALAALLLAACTGPAPATPSATPLRAATAAPSVAPSPSIEAVRAAAPAPSVAVGPTGPPPDPNTVPVPPAGSCHLTPDGLPDHACTPGLLNPDLTAAQLCAPGFTTKTIRPPVSYTDALKARLMKAYNEVGTNAQTGRAWSPADVELDHLVSLEDGGHPYAVGNLWPEPRRVAGAEPNAEEKDLVENAVKKRICQDQSHMSDYAARLAADWTQFRTQAVSLAPNEPTPEPEP